VDTPSTDIDHVTCAGAHEAIERAIAERS